MTKFFHLFFILLLILPFIAQSVELIDVNTAPLEELEKIIGIGPVLAQRIIEARPFNSLDDLINVKGIGEKTLEKIKDQGLVWVSSEGKLEPELKKETIPLSYPVGVIFNEILPSPEGPDEENEWIEIFNANNFEVDLSGWQIQDTTGKITTFILNNKAPALGYLVLKRPETKITLNNSRDGLNLLYPNGEIVDSISFEKAPLAQSYNKIQDSWSWSTILTPGAKNVIPAPKSPEQKPSEDKPRLVKSLGEKEMAALGEKIITKSSNYLPFLIALAVAFLSAILILFLKKARANQSG